MNINNGSIYRSLQAGDGRDGRDGRDSTEASPFCKNDGPDMDLFLTWKRSVRFQLGLKMWSVLP